MEGLGRPQGMERQGRLDRMTNIDVRLEGALPSNPDNTDAIQRALDSAQPGDTVYIPGGIYRIDAARSLLPRAGTNLRIDGTLQALPATKPNVVVQLQGVSNVTVTGIGTIQGERDSHPPGGNRLGFCVAIINSSNINLNGLLVLRDAWADGIYVQDSQNVRVNGMRCINNARNGMSIISVQTMQVTNSVFELTNSESPMPQAGIDIEPDLPSQYLLDISITGNQFIKNKGAGCYIAFSPQANRARIFVVKNSFDQHWKDGSGPPIGGRNSLLCNFLFAMCRMIPGYDYWAFSEEFTVS